MYAKNWRAASLVYHDVAKTETTEKTETKFKNRF